MFPFRLPNRQWLDAYSGLQQYFVGEVIEFEFRPYEFPRDSIQQYCNIGITLGVVRAPGTAAKQDGSCKIAAHRHFLHKCLQCIGGGRRRRRSVLD